MSKETVLQALRKVQDPDLHTDIVTLNFVKDVEVSDDKISFSIELTTPACPVKDLLKQQAYDAVAEATGIKNIEINMTAQVRGSANARQLLPQVKNIVPVASGKGGVGKSTVSANIALALAKKGAKVGLLDTDIYGPSIPTIMGITSNPKVVDQTIFPVEQYGVKVMSMGFFIQEDQAVVWRGPMLGKMVDQFLSNVEWGELDYLIIDLPPGTGDIQLSLCQAIPLTGAAIVSTPQDVAFNVARKAILMFNQLKTPVLGVIENMSYYVCKNCGQEEKIFGEGGGDRASKEFNIPVLGSIPLTVPIRETSDSGKPIVQSSPDSDEAKAFMNTAENLAAQVSIRTMKEQENAVKVTF